MDLKRVENPARRLHLTIKFQIVKFGKISFLLIDKRHINIEEIKY